MKCIKKYWIVFIIVFALLMLIKSILCMLMLGLMAIFIGIETVFFLKKIQTNGIECAGKIVGFETDSDGDRTPLVEFTTIKGESIKEKPSVYSSINVIEVFTLNKMINKTVSVLYDPDDPKRFVFAKENGGNSFSIFIVILIGLTFVVLSICNLLGYIKFG